VRVLPAVDLREGACVQLVGGSYADERVRIADPLQAARCWLEAGFSALHVVDLDAATGRGRNDAPVQALLQLPGLTVQVGGGVRSRERVDELLSLGAARVVVGTKALEEPAWLAEVAHAHPGRLVVAADVRGRTVVTRGWDTSLDQDVAEVLRRLDEVPLAAVLVTAVHREGQMQGTDLGLMGELARISRWPVFASGGVTTLDDLRQLADRGLAGAVIGMALYTNTLDAAAVAREFGR
jgi:phosphoribosylformimino-5-aminoimidazole carboxamide ribotide isomerase